MLTRKTQYAWMSLGGLICLFGLVLACKLRDGNRANAQPEELPPPPPVKKEASPSIFTLPPTLPTKEREKSAPLPTDGPEMLPLAQAKEPELQPPSGSYLRHPPQYIPPSPPFPLPRELSSQTKEPELLPPPKKAEKPSEPKATLEMPMPSEPSLVLPAAFGPNTPTMPEPTKTKDPTPPMAESHQAKGTIPPPITPPLDPLAASKPSEKKGEPTIPSGSTPASLSAPSIVPVSDHENIKTQPGEPPLAPAPGPVQLYRVHGSETLHDIARRTLGSSERWVDLHKLNPTIKPDESLRSGTTVRLPADACVQNEEAEPVKPLPVLRAKPPAPKAKVLPLTGTYQCSLDEKGQLTLPRAIRDQLGGSDTVLLSPGPDKCLWLTNQPHLERLGERLDHSQANETDVRVFKRLYFAQTEKLSINSDGRVTMPERLGQFAGLHQEVVLVGIDDHFEVWDAARWRSYTQQKSAGHSAVLAEQE